MIRKVLVLAALTAAPAAAGAILPADPDVILTCHVGEQLVAGCTLSCGSKFGAVASGYVPPGPKPTSPPGPPSPPGDGTTLANLSRVEFYGGGKVGRADSRTWIAWERGNDVNVAQRGVYLLGPGQLCGFDLNVGTAAPAWRVDRFTQ